MQIKSLIVLAALVAATSAWAAKTLTPAISGDYLEVRSCNVYTGHCVGNSEMNLSGREGILVWTVREGAWNGTPLNGLSVIAVLQTDGTLGDLNVEPRASKAVLIVDAKASTKQRTALTDFARSMAGSLIRQVAAVKTSTIEVSSGTCTGSGCAAVKAAGLVEISTQCLAGKHLLCGNEETFYPPMTSVQGAYPAYTQVAAYKGSGLDVTWETHDLSSAFLATFSR